MLSVRLQRTGRSGHAQFRIIVQDSRLSPTSGKVVKQLGHYNPHTKEVKVNKEEAEKYIGNGAQPSDRVVKLLTDAGVKMPKWVTKSTEKKKGIKNPEKLRRNRPAEESQAEVAEEVAEAPAEAVETPAEAEAPASE